MVVFLPVVMVLFLHIMGCKSWDATCNICKNDLEVLMLSIDQLKSLLQYVCEEGRICPQPNKWHELWEMLPDKYRVDNGWSVPLPLILDQWENTTSLDKMIRLKQHIEYAAEKDLLDLVEKFLKGLTREDWHIL